MAAPWFQLETTLKTNPKVLDLAIALDVKPVYARGHLTDFWSFVRDHFTEGVLHGRNLEAKLAAGASWDGKPEDFVAALIDCRFLHPYSEAPDVCPECFPLEQDGQLLSYDTNSGSYMVHGWPERISYFLNFEQRMKIKREQDAARKRKERAEKAHKTLSVHDRPQAAYEVTAPPRRGLRAAPRIVQARLIDARTGKPGDMSRGQSNGRHADIQPDVHVPSRGVSKPTAFQNPQTTDTATPEKAQFTPFPTDEIPTTTPYLKEDQHFSPSTDVTRTSDGRHADVTVMSLLTNKQTNQQPSVKDTSLSLSGESLKDGTNDVPSLAFAKQTGKGEPKHKDVLRAWRIEYSKTMSRECPEDLDRLAGAVERWHTRNVSYAEIIRRIGFFFESKFSDGRSQTFPIAEFQKKFVQLERGPIVDFVGTGSTRRKYGISKASGGEDFREYDATKQGNDFGPDN